VIKHLEIGIEANTWPSSGSVPPALTSAFVAGSYDVNLLGVTLFIGVLTRPPMRHGFALSDLWAWMRYLPAFASGQELRLKEEWSSIDFHHKAVASGDFGVGFSTWILSDLLGFRDYIDVLHVASVLAPHLLILRGNNPRGPRKSPDYLAIGPGRQFNIVECKGSQTSSAHLRQALGSGMPQKANATLVGQQFAMSLVSGVFVPQWESRERATLLVCDPDKKDVKSVLMQFSPAELGRASARVSYARDLAQFNMPSTVSTLMGIKQSPATIGGAIQADLTEGRAGAPVLENGRIVLRRTHSWDEPLVIDNYLATGISFAAEVPRGNLDFLRRSGSADEFGEAQWETGWQGGPGIEISEVSVRLVSTNGVSFTLSLLGKEEDQ